MTNPTDTSNPSDELRAEVLSIGEYLGCNEEELWSEMSKLFAAEKAKLQQAVLGCAPKRPPYPVESTELNMLHEGAVQGFSDGVQSYTTAITKVFEGGQR